MTYEEYYWTQSGQNRFRLNEITIWAVNKLMDTNTNTEGSTIFLRDQKERLVHKVRVFGWRKGSEAFRASINRWISLRSRDTLHIKGTTTPDSMHTPYVSLAESG